MKPPDPLKATAADWVEYGKTRRAATPAVQSIKAPRLSNAPHPSFLQHVPMTDGQYAARAKAVMERQAADQRFQAVVDEAPQFWNSPDE